MKKLMIMIAILLPIASQAMNFANISALCENDRGVELEIAITGFESLPPPHQLSFKYQGRDIEEPILIRETSNPNFDYTFIGYKDAENMEVFIGIDMKEQSIVVQNSANNGMSPLPSMTYNNCIIED